MAEDFGLSMNACFTIDTTSCAVTEFAELPWIYGKKILQER